MEHTWCFGTWSTELCNYTHTIIPQPHTLNLATLDVHPHPFPTTLHRQPYQLGYTTSTLFVNLTPSSFFKDVKHPHQYTLIKGALSLHLQSSLLQPNILTLTMLPLHPHSYTLTLTPSLLHPHSYTLTLTPSLLHPHSYTLTLTPSLLHPHSYTLTLTPSLLHSHSYTLTLTPSLLHPHS